MSRILIDLTDVQVEQLAMLVQSEHRSRAAIIREAIDAYLAQRKCAADTDVFGLWKGHHTDGVDYQRALRSEC
jgi:metal-responsive CopG/Arc/MetJ family transcriptional regulator